MRTGEDEMRPAVESVLENCNGWQIAGVEHSLCQALCL